MARWMELGERLGIPCGKSDTVSRTREGDKALARICACIGKIPWRREWLPSPVFLPGEFHGQRSLVGYRPWDHKESDVTEQLSVS